jgi:group I intron endonuclease
MKTNNKNHEIYVIECKINDKKYIGQTSKYIGKKKLKFGYLKRWDSHIKNAKKNSNDCEALYNAIRKYTENAFKIEKICDCDEINVDELEKFYIKKFNTLCPNGYNIRTGGKNGKFCEKSREKMRQSKLGKNNHNYGKPRSTETKIKISKAKSGKKHHFYGKKLTDEHKLKVAKSHRKTNEDLPMYLVKVKARPEHYCSEGYAVVNHPNKKNKYFTSKKLTINEKYDLAFKYLNTICN